MVRASPVGPRWTIGQFSRMTLLSARMLRHYDRLGLLRPGDVDPSNGYRYYSRDELAPALMLRRLREAGLGLEEASRALPAHLADDEAAWRRLLTQHLDRLDEEATELGLRRERTLALLHHRKEPLMSANGADGVNSTDSTDSTGDAGSACITTLTIPAHTIIARREIIPTYADVGHLFDEFEPQVRRVLAGGAVHLSGQPCGATFFDDEYVEHDVDVEIWEVVDVPDVPDFPDAPDAPIEVSAPLTCRTVPEQTVIATEHLGPYDGLAETYTALLQQIGSLGEFDEFDECGLRTSGHAFERYLVGPAHNPDPASWRTQVCFPISPAA